ncbi:hypothetical protein F2Q69_00032335 [Brassica cretica]|nr:hypothetical protein F2Q69_00032335 [Brassica cretica]
MVKEISLGMATDILPWSLFDELESKRDPRGNLERKTLFEFVNEWLTLKCEKTFTGSCRGLFLFGRREVLAEEVKREIERLKKMREVMVMVDELVDSEMSSFEGRWLDYKREAYEEGSEIEEEILSDLVDECWRLKHYVRTGRRLCETEEKTKLYKPYAHARGSETTWSSSSKCENRKASL